MDLKSKEEPVKASALITTVQCLAGVPSKFSDNELETLLPTPLAKIKYGKKEKLLRVRFDSFSQKSFVTKRWLLIMQNTLTSSFGLSLQSGVATAFYLSPNRPVFNIRLLCTNFPHIFFHYIEKLSLWFLSFPLSR